MNFISPVLNQNKILAVRRNHAVEHATINILSRQFPTKSISGYSNASGFWLIGMLPSDSIRPAVEEAVQRLTSGERSLAFHPNCGTNYVVMGSAAALAAWVGMLGVGKKWTEKLDRLPLMMVFSTLALILSQPVAHSVQVQVTTAPSLDQYSILRIEDVSRGDIQAYRVKTQSVKEEKHD